MRFSAVLGVAGVNPLEDYKARRVGRVFEVLVLMALLVVFAQVFMYYSGMLEESNWLTV